MFLPRLVGESRPHYISTIVYISVVLVFIYLPSSLSITSICMFKACRTVPQLEP